MAWQKKVVAVTVLAAIDGAMAQPDCSCKFQGDVLPMEAYTNFPDSEPGKYADMTAVARYGTMCATWDMVPGTPYKSWCPNDADFTHTDYDWCQTPWCWVDSSCPSAIASEIFNGSGLVFSYEACGSVDCWKGTEGCPWDPHGDSTYTVFKDDCKCMFHGGQIPEDQYTNYPKDEPGKYKDLANIELYGSTCAAWDSSPSTPWSDYCPPNAQWCHKDFNWCQAPWCWVDASCSTGIPSDIFDGSDAFFSYDTCLNTPNCYTTDDDGMYDARCPFDGSSNDWSTQQDCPDGWAADGGCAMVSREMARELKARTCDAN